MSLGISFLSWGTLALLISSCAFAPSFRGPKYDRRLNSLMIDPNKEVVLALTNATLDRKKRRAFDAKSKDIFTNLESYDGYIGGTVKVEIFGDEVWTMTVWEDEASLEKFVHSARHLDAMYMTNPAMKKFRHLNVKVLAKDLPYSWQQAQRLLEAKEFTDHTPF